MSRNIQLSGAVEAHSSITNQDYLDAANKTFETKHQEVFEHDAATPGVLEAIAETVPTGSEEGEVDFLGAMPVVRKWAGKKKFQSQRAYKHTYALETYEASFSLPRKKVVYDSGGRVGRRISAFMRRNRYWKQKIVFDELVTNPTGYDGVSLYSTSHPHGPGGNTQSNTTTSALDVGTLTTALVAGASLRDENSEPLGVSYNLMVVGPNLEKTAVDITGATRLTPIDATGDIDPGASAVAAAEMPNIYIGGKIGMLIVWPRLVGSYHNHWYLFDTTLGAPAMLLYEGDANGPSGIRPVAKTQYEDDLRFYDDEMAWSLESDHDAVAGAWQATYGGIVAA